MAAVQIINDGKAVLGIELGSTRIKAVLIDASGEVLAVGVHDWENQLVDGIWTYDLDDVHRGIRSCYADLRTNVEKRYGITLKKLAGIGISAMMHGYIPLDCNGKQLALFQTWRNTNTQQAADELTELFAFNIPLRWSVSHIYQRILDQEEHVHKIDAVYTLAAYIHMKLSGERVIGIGDASGMFPVDKDSMDYDASMLEKFDDLIAPKNLPWKLRDVLPRVLAAGESAGRLSEEGAALLDESGSLEAGCPMCPPEGDAGTGMVATNAVAVRTGNISAGTSTFAMVVLEENLKSLHREIDIVNTPTGFPVAMSHANNGTSDLNAWVGLFQEYSELMGYSTDISEIFGKLYMHSLSGDKDCKGLMAYGYYSGEAVTNLHEGRPIFLRTPNSRFTLANFMRAHLFSSLGAVKIGMDILKDEGVKLERLLGHGGFFKTRGVGQRYLSAAIGVPVTVMETAGEGGAWGIALLADYLTEKKDGERLEEFLENRIFTNMQTDTIEATKEEEEGFAIFMERYKAGLAVERAAVEAMKW